MRELLSDDVSSIPIEVCALRDGFGNQAACSHSAITSLSTSTHMSTYLLAPQSGSRFRPP